MNYLQLRNAVELAHFEMLESRRLLSAGAAIDSNGVLQVSGESGHAADSIVVSLKAGDSTKFVVDQNGTQTEFNVADVTGGINLKGGSGNDTLKIDETNGA